MKTILITFIMLLCLVMCACTDDSAQKQSSKKSDQSRDSLFLAVDTLTPTAVLASFPDSGLVEVSFTPAPDGLYAEAGLDSVYHAEYLFGDESLQLFMIADKSGSNYYKLAQFAAGHSQVNLAPTAIPFDNAYSLVFNHPEYGRIVAGLKSGWLMGAIGYRVQYQDFVADWVKGE